MTHPHLLTSTPTTKTFHLLHNTQRKNRQDSQYANKFFADHQWRVSATISSTHQPLNLLRFTVNGKFFRGTAVASESEIVEFTDIFLFTVTNIYQVANSETSCMCGDSLRLSSDAWRVDYSPCTRGFTSDIQHEYASDDQTNHMSSYPYLHPCNSRRMAVFCQTSYSHRQRYRAIC